MSATARLISIAATALLAGAPSAQQDAPQQPPARHVADVVYGHTAGLALTYDVLRPASPNGAAVVFIVSGGWRSAWTPLARNAARFAFLLDEGFTVYVLRHGSSPKFTVPEIVPQVRRGYRHIRLHASSHGVDPDAIGVFGGSAGGHLALLLATQGDDGDAEAAKPLARVPLRVPAVVAWYPPVDLRPLVTAAPGADGMSSFQRDFPALQFDPELADELSPLLSVSADDAPVLLVHGDADRLVPPRHSAVMRRALREHDVPVELMTVPGAGHGFDGEDLRAVKERMVAWFRARLLDGD